MIGEQSEAVLSVQRHRAFAGTDAHFASGFSVAKAEADLVGQGAGGDRRARIRRCSNAGDLEAAIGRKLLDRFAGIIEPPPIDQPPGAFSQIGFGIGARVPVAAGIVEHQVGNRNFEIAIGVADRLEHRDGVVVRRAE